MTRPGTPLKERLLAKVSVNPATKCWEWQGALSNGYGKLNVAGAYRGAHAVSYELHKGPVPKGLEVMHQCHNRLCCNPEHLEAGTRAENMRQCVEVGRSGTGGNPSTSGIKGVNFNASKGYWVARGVVNQKRRDLYHGDDFFEACATRLSFEAAGGKL